MKRRELIAVVGTALFAWPLVTRAQEQAKSARLGYLGFGTSAALATRVEALRAGLRDLGYVEGKNLLIEFRWSSTVEQMHEAAAELARMKVDIIFATSSTEVEAVRQKTKTIPIVFATHADPEGVGHVASLARPGGNITGLSTLVTELVAKELEIMKQALPRMTRGRRGVDFDGTLAPSCLARRRGGRPTARGSDAYGFGANIRGSRRGVRDDGARTCARFSLRGIAARSQSPHPYC